MLFHCYLIALTSILSFSQPAQKQIKPVADNDHFDSVFLSRIKRQVVTRFDNWLVKGEFEKTYSFQYRIKELGPDEFRKICFEETMSLSNWNRRDFTIVLKEYDADQEFFNVDLRYRGLQWKDKLPVPVSKAKNYRDSFYTGRAIISAGTWGVFNRLLYPKNIFFEDRPSGIEATFKLPIAELSDLSISSADIALSKPLNPPIIFSLFETQFEHMGGYTTAPEFPGGDIGWMRFIERTLVLDNTKNARASGSYLVEVSFAVEKDGSVSDIRIDKDPGFGIGYEVTKVIKKSPKWKPALLNDRVVRGRAKYRIPITIK